MATGEQVFVLGPGDPVGAGRAFFLEFFTGWVIDHRSTHLPFVAEVDGRLAGMAWLMLADRVPSPARMDRRTADIQSVYVVPELRDSGVGGTLIEAILKEARDRELEHVTVHSSERARWPRPGGRAVRRFAGYGVRHFTLRFWLRDGSRRLDLRIHTVRMQRTRPRRSARRVVFTAPDRRRDHRARWAAKWMLLFFNVALVALFAAWAMAASGLGNPLLPYLASLAFLLNITSAVVIRIAKPAAGNRFPVAWRGTLGKTGGFSTGLLLAFMSLMLFWMSFDA